MLGLPKSTVFNRRIPKQRFYDNLPLTPELKRLFIEQISMIYWRNKIAPSTVNIATGQTVKEIEVIEIQLNQPSLDKRVLQVIDKEIPYHILYLLTYQSMAQVWIGYKEQGKTGAFKPGAYYHSQWQAPEELEITLEGLNMDAVYEGFVRAIAGDRLRGQDLKEAVSRDERRKQLEREIAALESNVRKEKQFNIQVELNSELKKLRKELERLGTE